MIDGDIARSAEKCRSTAIKEPRMGSRPLFGRNLALFRVRLGSLRGGTIGNSYRTSGTNNKSVHYNISKASGTEAEGKLIRHEHCFPSKQKTSLKCQILAEMSNLGWNVESWLKCQILAEMSNLGWNVKSWLKCRIFAEMSKARYYVQQWRAIWKMNSMKSAISSKISAIFSNSAVLPKFPRFSPFSAIYPRLVVISAIPRRPR